MLTQLQDHGHATPSNDYHLLPVTERQLQFATAIAARISKDIPQDARNDRRKLSEWISRHKDVQQSGFDRYPSGKQVAFAERISRQKRRPIPHSCFRDRKLMSDWIDRNR